MKNTKSSKLTLAALLIILFLQALFCVYFGNLKQGFHDDEMATYTLSNFSEGFISRSDELIEKWVDSKILHAVLSVSGEEAFNYEMVYRNQEGDVHPPFYYYVVHTVSSLFPGVFSKWFGIIPNITFCLLTSFVMFFIAKWMLKSEFLALTVVVGWGFSIGAIDEVTFIRMYAMLTFFAVLFVFLHLKAFEQTLRKQKISVLTLIFMFLCTFCGLLSQYYFSVFALFLCGSFSLYLACTKRWRDLGRYVLAEFGAIGAAVTFYPAMFRHIFGGGYRGQEAFSNLKNTDNFFENIKRALEIISNDMLNGWTKALICFGVVMIALGVFSKFFKVSVRCLTDSVEFQIVRISNSGMDGTIRVTVETFVMSVITFVMFGYSVLISKVAPYMQDRYYMCLYPFFTLGVVYVIAKISGFVLKKQMLSRGLTLAVVLIVTVFGLFQQTPSYLYPEASDREDVLAEYADKPVIVMNSAYSWGATHWLDEYDIFSQVYLCKYSKSDFSSLKNAVDTNDMTNGFMLYALRFPGSDEEFMSKVREQIPVKDYTLLCGGADRVFYCTLEG